MTWTNGTEIVPYTLPSASGNCEYSLDPNLPDGVTLDVNRFELSGTPTAAMRRTQYTWTARNSFASTRSFYITVKPKAPKDFYVTPMPERKARLSWTADSSIPPDDRGFVVQVTYPSRSGWVGSQHQAMRDAGSIYKIEVELDRVHSSLGLAQEDYFEFQIMATDNRGSNYVDSDFSKTVRIFDNPIESLNGNSAGLTTGKAVAKWTTAEGPITYKMRYREMQGVHSSISWRPKEAMSEMDWDQKLRTHNANFPAKMSLPITGLMLRDRIYGFQLNYETETSLGFSAQEAYVWPSDRVSRRSGAREVVGGMPVNTDPVTAKTDDGVIAYFYRICEETFPSGNLSEWVNLINHALLQWEHASGGLIKMIHEVDSNGNSLRCADYTDFLDQVVAEVSALEMSTSTTNDDIVAAVNELLASFQNNGIKSTRTGDPANRHPERAFDLLQNEIMMLPDVTSLTPGTGDYYKRRTAIFSEVNKFISVGVCNEVYACARTSETTDDLGNRVRTSDIYLYESRYASLPLFNSTQRDRIKFNRCPTSDGYFNAPYSVLLHEAGHALGIAHPDKYGFRDSIMNYILNEPDCSPHPFDILAIYALYQSED